MAAEVRWREKLRKVRWPDPILAIGLVVGLVLIWYLVVDRPKVEDPRTAFEAGLPERVAQDEAKAEADAARASRSLAQKKGVLEESRALAAERTARAQAEARLRHLEDEIARGEERFPRRRFIEEILLRSQFSPVNPIGRPEGASLAKTTTSPTPTGPGLPNPEAPTAETATPPAPSAPTALQVAEGTWIPVILNNAIYAGTAGQALGTVRFDVYDTSGTRIAISKGSRVILEVIQDHHYFRSVLTARAILRPDGRRFAIPLAVHGPRGDHGLDVRQAGTFRTHLWRKLGLSAVVAAIGAAPSLASDGRIDDLAALTFIDRAAQNGQALLRDTLAIPSEKIFHAGARLNLLVVDTFGLPAQKGVASSPIEDPARTLPAIRTEDWIRGGPPRRR